MNRIAASLVVFTLLLQCSSALAASASLSASMKPIPVGQPFPDISFNGPMTDAELEGLGLKPGAGGFRLPDVRGQAVILVVFSMYCPFCQKEAPELSKMHEMIKAKGLEGKLVLAGLGAGNSPYEVGVFRDKFKLAFPLIPDQDFTAYKGLGQVGTPYYYVLKRDGKGFTIVDSQLGCVASAETFLENVLAKTGLKGK
ncbi:MAG: peroxiredoxin family protein [Thermodesulfobacteriota bacterium]